MPLMPQEVQKALDSAIIVLAQGVGIGKSPNLDTIGEQGLKDAVTHIQTQPPPASPAGIESARREFGKKMFEAARAYYSAQDEALLLGMDKQIYDKNQEKFSLLKKWLDENKAKTDEEVAQKGPSAGFSKTGLQAIKRANEKVNNLSELKDDQVRIRFGVSKNTGEPKVKVEGNLDINGLEDFLKARFGADVIEKGMTRKPNGKIHFAIPREEKDGRPVDLFEVMNTYKNTANPRERARIVDFPDKATAEKRMTRRPADDEVNPTPPASPAPASPHA